MPIYIYINTDTDKSVAIARGKEGQGTGDGRIERDFTWGDGHAMQCANDVLLRCTLDTCMVL